MNEFTSAKAPSMLAEGAVRWTVTWVSSGASILNRWQPTSLAHEAGVAVALPLDRILDVSRGHPAAVQGAPGCQRAFVFRVKTNVWLSGCSGMAVARSGTTVPST